MPWRWLCAAALLSGCAPTPAPVVVPEVVPAPAPAPEPPPPAVPVTYHIPARVSDTHYRLGSRTVLERDSAGQRATQELTSRAEAVVRLQRDVSGGFEGDGQLTGYRLLSGLSTIPIAIDSLRFDAVLNGQALRLATRPPLINECDRPESGALTLLRDVLVRVPSTVTIGDQWRDSTVQLVCRASVPMVVRTTSEYLVTDTTRDDAGVHVQVRRTSVSQVSGKSTTSWRIVEVSGSGRADLTARISVMTGAVEQVTGESMLTVTVTDRTTPTLTRAQTVSQRVTLTAHAITP